MANLWQWIQASKWQRIYKGILVSLTVRFVFSQQRVATVFTSNLQSAFIWLASLRRSKTTSMDIYLWDENIAKSCEKFALQPTMVKIVHHQLARYWGIRYFVSNTFYQQYMAFQEIILRFVNNFRKHECIVLTYLRTRECRARFLWTFERATPTKNVTMKVACKLKSHQPVSHNLSSFAISVTTKSPHNLYTLEIGLV